MKLSTFDRMIAIATLLIAVFALGVAILGMIPDWLDLLARLAGALCVG